jgi:hypothetical protein
MARIWLDGAEWGDTGFFDTITQSQVIYKTGTVAARSGNYCYGSGTSLIKSVPTADDEFYLRFGFYKNSAVQSHTFLEWKDASGNVLGSLRTDSSGYPQIYITTTVRGTGSIVMTPYGWHLIEVHIKTHATESTLEMRLDGNVVAVYSTGTEARLIKSFTFYTNNGGFYDDIALNDLDNTDGLADTTWCGDGHVVIMMPAADSGTPQLTPYPNSPVSHAACVNEIPKDNDTSYVEGSLDGLIDRFTLAAFPLPEDDVIIQRAFPAANVRDTVAIGGECALTLLSADAAEDECDPITLGLTYALVRGNQLKVDPHTSATWTVAALDAAIIGFKVIVPA